MYGKSELAKNILSYQKVLHGSSMKTIQLKLDRCERASQDAVTTRKKLDLCREEQESKEDLKRKIKTFKKNNDRLQNQLTSKNDEIENLQNRIRGLESEKTRIQLESSKNQREAAIKIRDLINENTKLQKSNSKRTRTTAAPDVTTLTTRKAFYF